MKKFTLKNALIVFFILLGNFLYGATIESITITQVDTIALVGKKAQPVLKVNIRVTGAGPLNMTRLALFTSNQNNEDVDSVGVYFTGKYNRFSLADYATDSPQLVDTKKTIKGDSAEFILSRALSLGDNYFWVIMDLSSISRAGRYLDAKIKTGGITIGGVTYPASTVDPSGSVQIYNVYFRENFETKGLLDEPLNWSQEEIYTGDPAVRWICKNGGFNIIGSELNFPTASKSGQFNALFARQAATPYKTILVSPPIDLSLSTKPIISFYHAQLAKVGHNDSSKILYKIGNTGAWKEIKGYRLYTTSWVKRELVLPNDIKAPEIYLGFEGTINNGWGVCIDSVTIFETGVETREIKEIVAGNYYTDGLPQGSSQNAIIRLNVRVKGNNSPLLLNSIKVTSANTSDNDIEPSGVRLYYTNDSVFLWPKQLGSAQSFSGGVASFSGLNKDLETGNNYLWVTYDIKETASPGNIVDAKIKAGDISISNGYTNVEIDPVGSRLIKQTLYFEDFEDSPPWTLSGEFEIAAPQGLGGLERGKPDPSSAYSGTKVLGTDLTGTNITGFGNATPGDYEKNILPADSYLAESPLIDGTYFKDITLQYYQYLNIGNIDTVSLQYKIDGTSSWKNIWASKKAYIESAWQKQTFNNLKDLTRKKFSVRFKLGSTDNYYNYSGLNVDYLFLTANYIPFDASVEKFLAPSSSCGLTNSEKVKVRVRNTGPQDLINTDIKLSLDGGKTYITETIAGPITVNDALDYEFSTPIDLSYPKPYSIIVKVAHPQDNFSDNDSIVASVISFPTYNLPYHTSFEGDTSHWVAGGLNSSWLEKELISSGLFKDAPDGSHCWQTAYSGYYNFYENSYVQSPCISFNGAVLPVIDVKYNYATNAGMDGAILQYTIDNGVTWKYVGEDSYDYAWNWYNDTVKTLKHKGWSGDTPDNKWLQGRQILPLDIVGNGRVQFRFAFKVDSTTSIQRDGFAFDDVKFYEAPYDIGVDTIKGIGPIACQYQNSPYLNVNVKNYSERSMRTNDIIVVGAKVNGVLQAVDTFKLVTDLASGAIRNFTFTKPVNFENDTTYTIKAFTMNGADTSFYKTDNDADSIIFTVNPNPLTGLPDRIATAEPDTVKLKLVKDLGYSYLWDNGSTDTTRVCIDGADKYYKATVTDKVTGCKTKDSTFIELLVSDISPIALLKPTDNCGYGALVKPIVKIKNTGTDTLRMNKPIPFEYSLDGAALVRDTVLLPAKLKPDSTVDLELLETMNLSAIKTYTLDLKTDLYNDNIAGNDVLPLATFTIFGYPTVDIGDPTIVQRDTMYQFTATPGGFASYKWSNDSISSTNTIKTSGWYKLTVTDNNGCPAKDSSYVFLKVRDVTPHRLVSPVTTCNNDALSNVILRIKNNGTDTIATTDNLSVSYQLDGGATVTEVLTPTSQIIPGDSVDFNFATQVDLITKGAYTFKMWLESSPEPDIIKENDTATFVVNVNGLPTPSIGIDMSIQALEYTIDPAGVGFVSYLWQDGSTDTSYVVTQDHHSADQRYQVTVTDINGCQNTTPKIYKILIVPDVSVSRILLAEKACALTDQELIKVEIKNTGNSTVDKEKTIRLKYQVNGGAFSKIDTLKLSSIFIENQVLTHTFKQLADLSALGTKAVKVFVEYADDVRLTNDTLTTFIEIFDMPVISLSATGTIVADLPYTLDPGAGFQSYLWSNGVTDQTLEVVSAGTYAVSVTNSFCLGVDTVRVIEKTFDLGISDIGIPSQACFLTNSETVSVSVVNPGTETLTKEPITLRYILNGTIDKSENFEFSGNTGVVQTFSFADKIDLSGVNVYTLEVTLSYANDEVADNNLLSKNISVTGAPAIVFAEEVNDTIRTTIFPYVLDAGPFVSYKWQDDTDNRVFSAPSEGWYKVVVVNTGGCTGSDSVFIRNTTAIRILDDKVKISIYPNPANDYLYVDMNLEAPEDIVLEVISASGKVISNKKLSGSLQYNEIVEALRLAKGVYYVRIQGKDWVITEKVIIQ